jgi:hypothetical protein
MSNCLLKVGVKSTLRNSPYVLTLSCEINKGPEYSHGVVIQVSSKWPQDLDLLDRSLEAGSKLCLGKEDPQ